jgi:hypothetical protein
LRFGGFDDAETAGDVADAGGRAGASATDAFGGAIELATTDADAVAIDDADSDAGGDGAGEGSGGDTFASAETLGCGERGEGVAGSRALQRQAPTAIAKTPATPRIDGSLERAGAAFTVLRDMRSLEGIGVVLSASS